MNTSVATVPLLSSGAIDPKPGPRFMLVHSRVAVLYVPERFPRNYAAGFSERAVSAAGFDPLRFDTFTHDLETPEFLDCFAGSDHVVLDTIHSFPVDDVPVNVIDEALGDDRVPLVASLSLTAPGGCFAR